MNRLPLLLLASAIPALTGCLPMMAVSGASMIAQSARGRPVSNEDQQPAAREACTQNAARYGTVHIIDVVQQTVSKIVVWGTVEASGQKRSFECVYGTRISRFTLRPIRS